MCVIVHLEPKKTISRKQLQQCFNTNSDGWGIMFARGGKLVTVKEKSDFNSFMHIWRDVPLDAERAVHFRIKTSGAVNTENCHPFKISEDMALMHNGMIDTFHVEKDMSDTYNYCKYELKDIALGWDNCLDDESFANLVEETTGWSKLLFMNGAGKVLKTRTNQWVERQGIYFSNGNSLYTYTDNTYRSNRSYSHVPYRDRYEDNVDDNLQDRYPNSYKALKDQTDDVDDLPDTQVSDLYSGNKTDAEGQRFLSEREEEERKAIQAQIDGLNSSKEEILETETEEEEDDGDPSFSLDFDQLLSMSEKDMLDWVQDYPKSTVCVIQGLIDTLTQAGIFTIEGAKKADKKSAAAI